MNNKEIDAIREEHKDYRGRHASWCYQFTKILNDMDARHEECTCHVKKIRTLIRALDDANKKIDALIQIRIKLEDELDYLRGI